MSKKLQFLATFLCIAVILGFGIANKAYPNSTSNNVSHNHPDNPDGKGVKAVNFSVDWKAMGANL